MNRLLEIKNFVESELNVSLTKRNRRKEVVQARYIYAKLACEFTSTTYEAKARAIKRNHASVLHYLKNFDGYIASDEIFKEKYLTLLHLYEGNLEELKQNPYAKYLGKEDKLQNAVMQYLKLKYPDVFAIHVPNEGKRTPFERYKFKYLGGVAGVPDILIFSQNEFKAGLALELKVGYNKPTASQEDCLKRLKRANWRAEWVNSFDAAQKIIDEYLDV